MEPGKLGTEMAAMKVRRTVAIVAEERTLGHFSSMRFSKVLVTLSVATLAILGWGYRTALSDPVVREGSVAVLPAVQTADLRVPLISDIHVAGPDIRYGWNADVWRIS